MLGGLVPLASHLKSCAEKGTSPAEAFQPDYQETEEFREAVRVYFQAITEMVNDSAEDAESFLTAHYALLRASQTYEGTFADFEGEVFQYLWRDSNLLYDAYLNGRRRYYNTGMQLDKTGKSPPEGYCFLLYFDGEEIHFYRDNGEWALRGSSAYRGGDWDSGNSLEGVEVVLAARETPEPVWEYTAASGSVQTSVLYALYDAHRARFFALRLGIGLFAAGIVLLVLSLWMRASRRAAKEAVRGLLARFWWEGKILFLAAGGLLTVLLFGWAAVRAGTGDAPTQAAALWDWPGEVRLYDLLPAVLAAFWLCFFAAFDLCGRPWRNSLAGWFAGRLSGGPFEKRMRRISAAFLAGVLLTAVLCVVLWEAEALSPAIRLIAGALLGVGLVNILYIYIRCCRKLSREVSALTGKIAAIRAGDFAGEEALPPGAALAGASQDLQEIQQGFDAALDERMKSERMKIALIANVSHDLKTPLTSILSYADLLCGENLPEPAGDYARILRSKALRLKDMVQDVFEVSKAASGQLPVTLERIDYGKLIRQTLADMAEAIEESPVLIREQLPDAPVLIRADGQRLYRVFQNLIQNALQYSLPGSRVYIRLEMEEGRAAASVKNTSQAELKPGTDYTERFVRGDESRTDGGSGLGLSIARSFTEACGGTLSIETDGDRFTAIVEFPLDGTAF